MRSGGPNLQMSIILNARRTTTNGTNFPKVELVRWSFHFRRHFSRDLSPPASFLAAVTLDAAAFI